MQARAATFEAAELIRALAATDGYTLRPTSKLRAATLLRCQGRVHVRQQAGSVLSQAMCLGIAGRQALRWRMQPPAASA